MIGIYKTKNKLNPKFICEIIKEWDLQYNLRRERESTLTTTNAQTTTFGIEDVMYLGQKIWNSLNKNIKDCPFLLNFKIEIKLFKI